MVVKDNQFTDDEMIKLWSEYIDWPKRRMGENGFFTRLLNRHGCKQVFDSCAGDGFDSISLHQSGFEVTSNEVDQNFRDEAIANIESEGLELDITPGYDWRSIPPELADSFDAVLCLGNSITYLFDKQDREATIRNFTNLIRTRGIVVLDQRNYDYILDNRDVILRDPQNNFRYSRRFYFCGETVDGYPCHIEDELVVFEYHHKPTGFKTHLELYPIRRQELTDLMQECGLEVEVYGDFVLDNSDNVDFIQQVGIK